MTCHPPPLRPQRPAPAPTSVSDRSWRLWAGLILAWPLALLAPMTLPQLKRRPARAGILAFLLCAKPLKTHIQTAKVSIVAARSQKSFGLVAKRAGGALPLIWLYTFPLGPAKAAGGARGGEGLASPGAGGPVAASGRRAGLVLGDAGGALVAVRAAAAAPGGGDGGWLD